MISLKLHQIPGVVHLIYGRRVHDIVWAIVYGSLQRDIDLFVVTKAIVVPRPARRDMSNFKLAATEGTEIDGCEMLYGDFLERVRNWDVVCTEPLLTGTVVVGDRLSFFLLRDHLRDGAYKASEKETSYLRHEGRRLLQDAETWLRSYPRSHARESRLSKAEVMRGAVSCLSYACSYLFLHACYSAGGPVTTLAEVLASPKAELLRRVRTYEKALNAGEEPPSEANVALLLEMVNGTYYGTPRVRLRPQWRAPLHDDALVRP